MGATIARRNTFRQPSLQKRVLSSLFDGNKSLFRCVVAGGMGMSCAENAGRGMMAKRKAAKRERIDTRVGGTDQLGPSMAADRQHKAKTKAENGQGDRGDQ